MIRHAQTADIFHNFEGASEERRRVVAKYLESFHAPRYRESRGGVDCPRCGALLYGGDLIGQILQTFEWGLSHGEGHCRACKWPVRMFHEFESEGGRRSFTFPLAHRTYPRDDEKHERENDPDDMPPVEDD